MKGEDRDDYRHGDDRLHGDAAIRGFPIPLATWRGVEGMLVIKAAIGAAVVLAIALLSRSRNYFIAGLAPLFPTFAIIAHYIVGSDRSTGDLKTTIIFGMWSLVPYLLYLISVYVLIDHLSLNWAILTSVLIWAVAAYILIAAWTRICV
jgi:uncharacterized membrane protein (GlpM family)